MRSDYSAPVNLGTDEVVSVDDLVDMVCTIANKALVRRHIPRDRRGFAEETVKSRG
jgi:GDP-D-mannose 3', 5'-epimerase